MTTEENNRMIAEFMGFKLQSNTDERWFGQWFTISNGTWANRIEILHFHTSWDWLMPVVEKIERLEFTIEKNFQRIDGDYQCLITKGNDILFQEFNESSITAMHYVVAQFIEWHNKQQKS